MALNESKNSFMGGVVVKLIPGRRYEWYIDNVDSKKKDGLFTGEFDERNGNALLQTRNGEKWSIPPEDLKVKKR